MNEITKYFNLQKEIYDYFGYTEDWVIFPMVDHRDVYWSLDQDSRGGGDVRFHEDKDAMIDKEGTGEYYDYEIYTQRFLPKWVYRAKEYTMIVCDTHIDGNKFLAIFDNELEVDNEELSDSFDFGTPNVTSSW